MKFALHLVQDDGTAGKIAEKVESHTKEHIVTEV